MTNVDFTVAIPTYNGASRLPKVLDKLKSQLGTEDLIWEIFVVDNNSADETAKVVQNYQANWTNTYPLRYCFEAKQGLAFARQRAVEEAQGKLIGFIDDDILPASNWVIEADKFGQKYPKAGAYGGQIYGEFEAEPPPNFNRIKSFLAIRERGEEPHLYDPNNLSLPPGAALVIRKDIWLDNVPTRLSLLGRVKESTLAGEDYEALIYISKAGWEIWYNPTMRSYHQISAQRLTKDYLIPLVRGCGLCICHVRLVKTKLSEKPLIITKIFLGNLRRLFNHWWQYRGQVKTDLVTACEREFLRASCLSPLYFLKTIIRN